MVSKISLVTTRLKLTEKILELLLILFFFILLIVKSFEILPKHSA